MSPLLQKKVNNMNNLVAVAFTAWLIVILYTLALCPQMRNFLKDYQTFIAPQQQIKIEIYSRRVLASIEKYKRAVKEMKGRLAEARRVMSEIEELRQNTPHLSRNLLKDIQKRELAVSQHVKAGHVELPHKLFLPNGTAAALVRI